MLSPSSSFVKVSESTDDDDWTYIGGGQKRTTNEGDLEPHYRTALSLSNETSRLKRELSTLKVQDAEKTKTIQHIRALLYVKLTLHAHRICLIMLFNGCTEERRTRRLPLSVEVFPNSKSVWRKHFRELVKESKRPSW